MEIRVKVQRRFTNCADVCRVEYLGLAHRRAGPFPQWGSETKPMGV